MRRREFITLLGGMAITHSTLWPLAARAQHPTNSYRLGFLTTGAGPETTHKAFDAALAELGYLERSNLVIERRYAAGNSAVCRNWRLISFAPMST